MRVGGERRLRAARLALAAMAMLLAPPPSRCQSSCAAGTADLDSDGDCDQCFSSVPPTKTGFLRLDVSDTLANAAAGCAFVHCFLCSTSTGLTITSSGATETRSAPACSSACGCVASCPVATMAPPTITHAESCAPPPPAADLTVALASGSAGVGPSAAYTCTATGAANVDGTATRTCQAGGAWSGTVPTACCASSCAQHLAIGGATGMVTMCAGFDVYCDSDNDGGGWALVASINAPQRMFQLDNAVAGAALSPNGNSNTVHPNFAQITGTDVRVGRFVGQGTTAGNVFQINDCGGGDAACVYGARINQNDGDGFGAWITSGGSFNNIPGGCTGDGCPAGGGDRDHSQANRIAIFGGDCHSSCADRARNGFTYFDYGSETAPARAGDRFYWSEGTTSPGQEATITTEVSCSPSLACISGDAGSTTSSFRDVWIRA